MLQDRQLDDVEKDIVSFYRYGSLEPLSSVVNRASGDDFLNFWPFSLAFGSAIYSSYTDCESNPLGLSRRSTEQSKSIAPIDLNRFMSNYESKLDWFSDRSRQDLTRVQQ
jgi:hypothetical protein